MAFFRWPLILLILCCPAARAWAVQLTVPLSDKKPTVDGTISAEERQGAASLDLIKVGSLDKPKCNTKVYLKATLEGLYVAFDADEPRLNDLVTSITAENGAVFNDDSVQVLISPTMDTAADSYYHFVVNAKGIRYSNYLVNGETVQNWQSAVSQADGSWQGEFFIPLSTIKASDELPYWRANFARFKPAVGDHQAETTAWINPGISLHNYKKFGYLTMPRFVPAPPASGAAINQSTTSTVQQ